MTAFLQGAVGALSLVAALFFLKFWRDTRDTFFALFAAAFVVDALVRAIAAALGEQTPIIYAGRLVSAGLIIMAILRKTAGRR